jgi:dipeptidyl aminopeptidase/acylaminoacyl peptidase
MLASAKNACDFVPLLPLEDFFRNPNIANLDLAPGGGYLAFLQPWQTRMNIFVQQTSGGEAVRVTSSHARDIPAFLWKGDERLVYVQDSEGDENYQLFAVDVAGQVHQALTPFAKVQARIVDDLEYHPSDILIALNRRNPQLHDVYRINVFTGDMHMVAENPGNISSWVTDHGGRVRAAVTTNGVNTSLLYRENEGEPFRTVLTTSFRETLAPLFFTFDNRYLYAASNIGRDKTAIVIYDIVHGKEQSEVFAHPEVDVEHLLCSRRRKVITGAAFTTWKREYHFFDACRQELQGTVEERLPGYEVSVSSMSKDERRVIVRTFSDKSLGAYYFYDATSRELRKLNDVSPWLDEAQMADMRPIVYTSRDGLTIHGYLTLPRGRKPESLPVVVNVHGGPWYRDSWGYNREVQFLANRGYAVLQMNFRGSTGYGRKFWELSFKEWGRKMQDDVTDGVHWLIAQGIADQKRIAVYGGSYGGYAALAGLAFTPELYACGIAYVGVSNLITFMQTIPPYWKPYLEMIYEMIGHPEKERTQLEAVSPLFHADKITSPLLIAQGANDPRVNKNESDQIVAALKAKGIDVPYLLKDNEGHGFRNEENRFDFYRAMDSFLAKHLLPA